MHIGTEEQFAGLRRLFAEAQFDEAAVLQAYGVESYEEIDLSSGLGNSGTFIRLFIAGLPVQGDELSGALALLQALELVEPLGAKIVATIALYPMRGLYIASDRWRTSDGSSFLPRFDIVYSALTPNAQLFLDYLPNDRCESLLDMCSGTGVAALLGARLWASHSVASDIAARCTRFAEFNARLNGIENCEAVTGDLYAPVAGRKFDRIVAHPPYVATSEPDYVYRDGGADGEEVLRRIVAGCGEHLVPGGLLYLMATATDREGEPYEQRVRKWLGDSGKNHDVLVVPFRSVDPDLTNLAKKYAELNVTKLVYSLLIVRKKLDSREPFTIRRQKGPRTSWAEIRTLLEWEGATTKQVLAAKVRANDEAELRIDHELTEEGWAESRHVLHTLYPFSMEATVDTWAPFLMTVCDGSQTVEDCFTKLQSEDVLPEDAVPEEFAQAVAILASGGFLFLNAV